MKKKKGKKVYKQTVELKECNYSEENEETAAGYWACCYSDNNNLKTLFQ